MVTYVKKNIPGIYVTMEKELDKNLHNDVGNTYEQYLNNWWVLLNDDQLSFHNEYPDASIKEVFELRLESDQTTNDLTTVKNNKIQQLIEYDNSDQVNIFIINDEIKAWLTVEERLNYKQSVEAAKLLNEKELDFLINDAPFTISITSAEYLLAQIQRYADKCFLVTAQHKKNINNLSTIEQINEYDYTTGYPEILKFELS